MEHDKEKDSPSAGTLRETFEKFAEILAKAFTSLKAHIQELHTVWYVKFKAAQSIRHSKAVIKGCEASQRNSAESIRLSNYVIERCKQISKDQGSSPNA